MPGTGIQGDEVRVGVTGNLYYAPQGSTAPDDVATAWDAEWVDLGYLSEDGFVITPTTDSSDIMVWQSLASVRKLMTSRTLELKYTLMQHDAETFKLAMGGGDIVASGVAPDEVYTYTAPGAGDVDERMFGLEWRDGPLTYRFVFPRGVVTDVGDIGFLRTDAVKFELTTSVLAVDDVTPLFTYITNDAAFAAAA